MALTNEERKEIAFLIGDAVLALHAHTEVWAKALAGRKKLKKSDMRELEIKVAEFTNNLLRFQFKNSEEVSSEELEDYIAGQKATNKEKSSD